MTSTSHERHGVSNHRQLYCLLINLFKLTTKQAPTLWIVCPLWGDSNGQRWIPFAKGQRYGSHFHKIFVGYKKLGQLLRHCTFEQLDKFNPSTPKTPRQMSQTSNNDFSSRKTLLISKFNTWYICTCGVEICVYMVYIHDVAKQSISLRASRCDELALAVPQWFMLWCDWKHWRRLNLAWKLRV